MNEIYQHNDIRIQLRKRGADRYAKISYPQRYGIFSEIETSEAILLFNLNGEITHAKGKGRDWPDRQEWLKRTVGNDWIYYSTGGYAGVFEAIGEYYLPNTPYPTNSLIGGNPLSLPPVAGITSSWYQMLREVARRAGDVPAPVRIFLERALANTPEVLVEKAKALFAAIGGRITVLPPDARHVDYDLIPLTVAEGCLYKCRFCRVKSDSPFREKGLHEIDAQITTLKETYGENLINYNSLFLGEHDALCARPQLIMAAIEQACAALGLFYSYMQGTNVFSFGSIDSLLNAPQQLFDDLARLPVNIYLNIGLESADQATLDKLGKPVTAGQVEEAFVRIQDINDRYLNIELTANFVMDERLPENHYPAFLRLVRDSLTRTKPKGSVYLSPLRIGKPSRSVLFEFNRLKVWSRLPTYLYIIQRL
jgi:Radical SAM superfamily